MLFGTSYYHEYLPIDRLDDDIRLMKEAGLNFVRMGDSIWTLSEPRPGEISFDAFARVVDAMHAAGLKVVLMTPTYAIPAWLHRHHPEVMARYASGERAYYGGRQNVDLSHPAFLHHAERIIRAMAERFSSHPAVVGWQVDNETRHGMVHNHGAFERFRDHLKSKFGSPDRLNEVWGLSHWSHRLVDWEDLWKPDGNRNPGYDLEWRRFQASLVTRFLAWQASILREYTRPDQFITQDLVGGWGLGESDRYEVAQALDVIGENPYHSTQDGLALPLDNPDGRDRTGSLFVWAKGVSGLQFSGDLGRSARQSNFLITETNAQSLGATQQYPAYDGQWRQAAYAFISRGANAITYWHWHSLHYGAESHIAGILNHAFEPTRCYAEISKVGQELSAHGETLTDLSVDADVAVLYSQDTRYAMEFLPPFQKPDAIAPDPTAYRRIVDTMYRACFDARAETAIVHPQQDFSAFPVLVAPAVQVADDPLLEKMREYAERGGHLVLTFRTGYTDEFGRARWTGRAPDLLREAAGAGYGEFSALTRPVPLRPGDVDFDLPAGARMTDWAEGLELEGAQALAYYDHPHFGRYPAVTSHAYGKGRVTYVGGLPDEQLGRAIMTWALEKAGITVRGAALPEEVRVSRAVTAEGDRLWFVHNWSWKTHQLTDFPFAGRDLLAGLSGDVEGRLTLGPWDVRILIDEKVKQ